MPGTHIEMESDPAGVTPLSAKILEGAWGPPSRRSFNFVLGPLFLFRKSFPARSYAGNQIAVAALTGATELIIPATDDFTAVDALVVDQQPIGAALPAITTSATCIRYVVKTWKNFYLHLGTSFDQYLQSIGKKSRKTLLYEVRKFAEFSGGEADFRVFRAPGEILAFHTFARQVSSKTYQERNLKFGFPDTAEFKKQLTDMAAADAVRGFVLFHQQAPIAFMYCPVIHGVVHYEQIGYDPAFRRHSPGTVLQYYAFRSLFEEQRFELLDFGSGEGRHKEVYSSGFVTCSRIFYFAPTFRNRMLVTMHKSFNRFADALASVAERSGVKRRIKKLFHR